MKYKVKNNLNYRKKMYICFIVNIFILDYLFIVI